MKSEKERIVKRYICNCNILKTEKWFSEQAKEGWKLSEVKSGIFCDTFVFCKSQPCDLVYLTYASFPKMPKYKKTSDGAVDYLIRTYGGKKLTKDTLCNWFAFKKNSITDVQDFSRNNFYREECIRKEYLTYFLSFLIISVVLLVFGLVGKAELLFYCLPVAAGVVSLLPLVKLIFHSLICKKAYIDFM